MDVQIQTMEEFRSKRISLTITGEPDEVEAAIHRLRNGVTLGAQEGSVESEPRAAYRAVLRELERRTEERDERERARADLERKLDQIQLIVREVIKANPDIIPGPLLRINRVLHSETVSSESED